ncbi:YbgA family protein [Desulfobacula phenolica]|uniref:Uncharacterized conserved protein YbgA, DUF1722 family n=1 Tax=Desulfobacula phenolica TaxID=90732 RepID=A0A1H2JJ44_9BACT|nr:DUF523 and DUF1722 domain-containing protein [Desulfobacula phenolica]SDU56489.1 Uncharacterized conserved protein YbgA, DUF1722 family [Desulfobacula phenolica]
MLTPIKIGISSCLLGNKVRYDGGHSHDRFLTQTLGLFAEYVPVCPEVECGMPIPREAVRLVGTPENPKLVTQKTGQDKTRQMKDWIPARLKTLEQENLCGFIFKSKSPSSGLYRIRVYGDDGKVRKTGTGLFARAFTQHFPRVPVEEAGRLHDPELRENFIEAIFSLQRWRDLLKKNRTPGGLVDFHTRNKLLILSHNQDLYRKLGKLVAQGKTLDMNQLFDAYEKILLNSLKLKTTVKKNINVLHHILGYFKRNLTGSEKHELLTIIDQYRSGYVPLIVPITLIRHYVMKYDQPWLKIQTYLNPHPFELKLRNYF